MTTDPSTAPPRGVSIDLRNVRKTFDRGEVVAIDALNLTVEAGEFISILGPSGCGKSTLLRLIAQLDTPTAGTITFGASLHAGPSGSGSADDQPARTAYVFQDAHLLPWRNVLRNVALPLELSRVGKRERLDRAREALARVGLSDALRRYPAQLSGGMRMRVSLARALVTKPSLLLLDEPFAALDEITRQQLDEQLRELWLRSGMTVLFVTHSVNEAAFLAQRAIVLSPRPARTLLDHAIDLPDERDALLRGQPAFAHETATLFAALRGNESHVTTQVRS